MWTSVWLCVFGVPFIFGAPANLDIEEPNHFNVESVAGLFEGDIDLDGNNPFDRNGVKDLRETWPNGVIPYTISSHYSDATKETIVNAMKEIENDTRVNGKPCITYVPRSHQHDYVEVASGSGCHSHIGRAGGKQIVTISNGCYRKGTIMHEFIHALGFWHEQSETTRDQYVTIVWNNIESGKEHNFQAHPSSELDTFGVPYDYDSIMHYNAYEFSKDDNKPTIITKKPGVFIGQRIRLSTLDIKKIQILYGCIPRGSSYMPPTVGTPKVYSDSCTFQSGMCDWQNLGSDRTNWVRRKGRTPSGRTGPNYDHSLSYEGYYIYMEASHHSHYTAVMASKQYPAGTYCVTFYYHMYGPEEGKVYLRVARGTHVQNIHTISGDHGDLWKKAEVPYTSQDSFQFQFEGIIGSGSKSDIALDDIAVHTGACPSGGGIIG
ncbi:meprin A subunit beta-like [Haliotis cracherodii]|uniref:meprin A subunit beta-like n=1 Tax=Haliotis cracherodii TaxID=6455 RepID=UPI0039ED805D